MEPFYGMILPFAGAHTIKGWLQCAGSTLNIAGNQVLFSVLGTRYGGDGITNFNLPDLQNAAPTGGAAGAPYAPATRTDLAAPSGSPQVRGVAVQFQIAKYGVYPSRANFTWDRAHPCVEVYIGLVMPWAGSYAPSGWFVCDGSLLAIWDYPALFSVIGTRFGGDGSTTFALPNLVGRVPLHPGQGAGLPGYTLGQTGTLPAGTGGGATDLLDVTWIIAASGLYPPHQ